MPASENARSAAVISTVRVPPSSLRARLSSLHPDSSERRICRSGLAAECWQSNCFRRQLSLRYSGDLLTKLAFGLVIRSCPLTRDVMFSCGFAGSRLCSATKGGHGRD